MSAARNLLDPGSPPLRVLVIDDDPDGAAALRRLLALLGHEVTVACSGGAGLRAVLPAAADVVLCDLGLPDIDGFEVALRLRDDPRTAHLRIVAITGYRMASGVAALAAGFDAWLVKPVDVERLREAIAARVAS